MQPDKASAALVRSGIKNQRLSTDAPYTKIIANRMEKPTTAFGSGSDESVEQRPIEKNNKLKALICARNLCVLFSCRFFCSALICRSILSGKNKLIGLKKRGFAIPSVLLSITLILSIVIGYSTSAQNHVLRVKRYLSEVDGQLAARSGLELAVGILLERFASPEYEQKLTLINGDAVYCRYNKRDRLAISIQDIAGRIDLNFASKSLLEKYFSSFHEQHVILENVTQAIIERRQIRAYAIVDELQELEGIDPAFFQSIRNDLTTFGIQNSLANDALSEELKKRLQRSTKINV